VTRVVGTGVSSTNQNPGTTIGPATASCTGGKVLVGGGADITGNTGSGYAVVSSSYASTAGSQTNGTWTASGVWAAKASVTLTVTAYALCAG
jgi:hypothetical protein